MKRVILAFSKEETAYKIKRMLEGSAYEICFICHSAPELMRLAAGLDDIFIIMGYKIGDMLADEIAYELDGVKLIAIIKAEHRDMIENENIFPIILPINRETMLSALEIFTERAGTETKKRRTADEEKIIERAKLYLIEKHGMTEDLAHRFIQKKSMDNGEKFIDTARLILRL